MSSTSAAYTAEERTRTQAKKEKQTDRQTESVEQQTHCMVE